MKASVIISDVNPQGMLLPCVHAVCNQDFSDYEIILPDYGLFRKEDEALLSHFEAQYHNFRILRNETNNRSALINEAVRRAKGKILLFLESHCIVDKNWVKNYVDLFGKKKIQIALGKVRTMPSDSYLGKAEEHMRLRIVRNNELRGTDETYFDFHNSAMTRKCFIEASGLSENIPLLAEFEFGARIHQSGIDIFHFSDGYVWHANSTPFWKYKEVIGGQGRDKVMILMMHGSNFLQKYFPSRHSLNFLNFLKIFRLPSLVLMKLIIYVGMAGCNIGRLLNAQGIVNFYFYIFAKGCFWRGILMGLKEFR